jgi:predicted metal-dependent peptidase
MEKNLIRDINNITKNLHLRDMFFGLFFSSIKKEERLDIPLAAVGLNKSTMDVTLYINPKEWFKTKEDGSPVYSDEIKEGIILHEASHITYFHLINSDNWPNKEMANVAMDLEINQRVGKNNLPSWACFIEDFKIKYPQLDWKENAGTNHYYSELNKLPDEDKQKLGIDERAKHRWVIVDGNGKRSILTEAEKASLSNEIQATIERLAEEVLRSNGTLSAEIEGMIKGFIKPKPSFNYKQFIKNFVGQSDKFILKGSKLKENQRFLGQTKIVKKHLKKIAFYVDQSGSMGQEHLENVVNEGFHLRKNYDVTFFAFDTRVIGEVKLKKDCLQRLASGGTDPLCCIEHFEKTDFTTAIIYTDGHFGSVRTTNKDLLWVIDPDGSMQSIQNQKKKIKISK